MKKRATISFIGFLAQFPDELACLSYFEAIRFRDGQYCAHCSHKEIYRFNDGKRFRCAKCKKDFTLKTGTIFGESKISLHKWFIAIYLLTTCKKGISSVELSEKVGVTQKTGWFMDHRIRNAMRQGKMDFFGSIEADETYVGGKERNKHLSKRHGKRGRSIDVKTPVLGILERSRNEIAHSKVKITHVPNVRLATLEKEILGNVTKGSKLFTDNFNSYKRIGKHYQHATIDHISGEYVRGDVHTNSIESFWATFKRGYIGTYHHMSHKHLQQYLNEFAYRFNGRIMDFDELFADMISKVSQTQTLKYKVLTQSI